MYNKTAIVVGAGIVGLATARALAIKGYKVTVIEKSHKSYGASIRNFGMVWPIGQPDGPLYEMALRTKSIWKDFLDTSKVNYNPCGSLHVATNQLELNVIEELYEIFLKNNHPVALYDKTKLIDTVPNINKQNVIAGLYSDDELIINAREAIWHLPSYLETVFNVTFQWGTTITAAKTNEVWSFKTKYQADLICICNGADFETLFPYIYQSKEITKCKLQMMRFKSNDSAYQLGPAICAGLSLVHYTSFKASKHLSALYNYYIKELPAYLQHGIHVMVSQNMERELTVGDTHEYGLDFDPFDNISLNEMVLQYLKTFLHIDEWHQFQSWNGVYAKMTNGDPYLFLEVEKGVYILNGIGGHGMTMSFGFAEQSINSI